VGDYQRRGEQEDRTDRVRREGVDGFLFELAGDTEPCRPAATGSVRAAGGSAALPEINAATALVERSPVAAPASTAFRDIAWLVPSRLSV
jgi:hypothetical protein